MCDRMYMVVEAQTQLTSQTCSPCSESKLLILSEPQFPHFKMSPFNGVPKLAPTYLGEPTVKYSGILQASC